MDFFYSLEFYGIFWDFLGFFGIFWNSLLNFLGFSWDSPGFFVILCDSSAFIGLIRLYRMIFCRIWDARRFSRRSWWDSWDSLKIHGHRTALATPFLAASGGGLWWRPLVAAVAFTVM